MRGLRALATVSLALTWACTTLELPGGPFSVGGEGGGTGGSGGSGGAGGSGGDGGAPLPPRALVTDEASGLAGLAVTPDHVFWLEADAGILRLPRGGSSSADLWQTGNGPVASASQLLRRDDRLFWLRRPDPGDCGAVVEEVSLTGLSFEHPFSECFSGVQLAVGEQRIFAALDTATPENLREATVGAATSFGASVVGLAIAAPESAHADARGGVLVSGSSSDCDECTFRFAGMSAAPLTSELAATFVASDPTQLYLARGPDLWRASYEGSALARLAEVDGTIIALEVSPAGALYLGLALGADGAVVRVGDDGSVTPIATQIGEPRFLASDEASLFIGAPPSTIWRVDLE